MDGKLGIEGVHPDEVARQAAWQADRATEAQPLPGHGRAKYRGDWERAAALAAAERSNVARTAGEMGLTSDEFRAKAKELGRSPRPGDLK